MYRFVFFAMLLPIGSFAADNQLYRASIRHIESGGIGYDDGYTTLEMFLSSDPAQRGITTFLDGRAHVFNDGKWAANAGIGLRTLCGSRVYGINTYYDYRNVGCFKSNQFGIGVETLGEVLDLRINGYLPFGKKHCSPYDPIFEGFSSHYALISQKYRTAMKGVDAELGIHVGNYRCFEFYAAAGPYYYTGRFVHTTCGGKARIAGKFNDFLTLEISDSYDRTFHNKFQARLSLNIPFGPRSKNNSSCYGCPNNCILQSVERQEIIVVDTARKNSRAIDPNTGRPYFFVFVDNTSSSKGTYESPYHTLIQAQENSSSNDIIYVFPGDGTTAGMDSGISLKTGQKFWGSGLSYSIQTSQGLVTIPAQSQSAPNITNTNIDTEGNAITLATNNEISGITITSALNDAIYGTDIQSLKVSSCTFENNTTFAIEASFHDDASVSLTNNQFLSNVNGVLLNLNGTSTIVCSDNIFTDQTSVSSAPLEISSNSNIITGSIENNVFSNNTTGSIRFGFNEVVDANISVLNNTFTNNGTGSQSSLGSNVVLIQTGITNKCAIVLNDNTFSDNASNSLYLHTSGAFSTLDITATANQVSNNGGSAIVLATPVDSLTLLATDNSITECNDNGIAVIGSGVTTTGNITISNNIITDIGNASNGIAINQDFSSLNLSILNNEINRCEGTGIISYAPTGINSLNLTVSDNVINNCQNLSSNMASGLDIEQYTNFEGHITNNTLLDNTGIAVAIGSTLPTPEACLELTGNDSTDYLLTNPVDSVFNLSPCNVDSVNVGTINTSGVITPVQSCPDGDPCPP